jgi:hypothetical protein
VAFVFMGLLRSGISSPLNVLRACMHWDGVLNGFLQTMCTVLRCSACCMPSTIIRQWSDILTCRVD